MAVLAAMPDYCDSESEKIARSDAASQILRYDGKLGATMWIWPVAVSPKATDETKEIAKQLASALNLAGLYKLRQSKCTRRAVNIDSD
jgi:hypothetical protein